MNPLRIDPFKLEHVAFHDSASIEQGGSFPVANYRRTGLNRALVGYSAQHESFDGSLRRDMATIFNASAIVG